MKEPAVNWMIVVTPALGIGATTATFSIFKAVVLDPLPYREPERLVIFGKNAQDGHGVKRSAARASEFLSSVGVRNRAICAIAESDARTPNS